MCAREGLTELQIGESLARGSHRRVAVSARSNSLSPYLEGLAPPSRKKLQQSYFRARFENKSERKCGTKSFVFSRFLNFSR